MKEITNDNFKTVLEENPLLAVDFWASWCKPCKNLAPVIESLAEEYEDIITFAKCNIEDADEIADEFKIQSIPTIIFFKNGQSVDKISGAVPKATIKEACDKLLNK